MEKINEIKKPAIIGAGTMGSDIALDLACYNFKVILLDINEKILKASKTKIENNYQMIKMIKGDLKSIDLETVISRIKFTQDYSMLTDADLIIENATEDISIKKEIYTKIAKICQINTLFAINTSCISITQLASLLPNPSNVAGMHFMNPVPLKNIVETIKGYHTSEQTLHIMDNFLKKIKKRQIVVNDLPGFVVNRLSHLFMNEAAFLVQDRVAAPKEIDILFKQGYGHPMGPLETADLIGLDTVLHSINVLYKSYQDQKYRCCPLLRKMVDAGLLGMKSGEGFYKY